MKFKKEYIVLAVLIIGLILYLLLRQTDRTHYSLPDIPKIDGNSISKLEISNSSETIDLNKKDNNWFIGPNAYPADADHVKKLIEAIENLSVTTLISESKNYFRYELSDEKKIKVKAFKGNDLVREFDVGKTAPTYQHTFIRLSDDPNVYHAKGSFRTDFDQTADDLRDKSVLTFDQNIIHKIRLTKEDKAITLTQNEISEAKPTQKPTQKSDQPKDTKPDAKTDKKNLIWQTDQGKTLETSQVKSLIRSLSKLKCDQYITDRKKDDFKDPVRTIALTGLTEHTLYLFPKAKADDEAQPAVSSGNDYPFELSGYTAKDIRSQMDKLFNAVFPEAPETKTADPESKSGEKE